MKRWFQRKPVVGSAEKVLIGPGAHPILRIGPARPTRITPAVPVRIAPPPRGAWQERGWERRRQGDAEIYEGSFQAGAEPYGARRGYRGRILQRQGQISAFVHDPPDEIRRHPKAACFSYQSDGWFQLHWHRSPANVDDALLYVERILNESLR